jgi:hypothetical protein
MSEGWLVFGLIGIILGAMLIGAWWNKDKPPGMGM